MTNNCIVRDLWVGASRNTEFYRKLLRTVGYSFDAGEKEPIVPPRPGARQRRKNLENAYQVWFGAACLGSRIHPPAHSHSREITRVEGGQPEPSQEPVAERRSRKLPRAVLTHDRPLSQCWCGDFHAKSGRGSIYFASDSDDDDK